MTTQQRAAKAALWLTFYRYRRAVVISDAHSMSANVAWYSQVLAGDFYLKYWERLTEISYRRPTG